MFALTVLILSWLQLHLTDSGVAMRATDRPETMEYGLRDMPALDRDNGMMEVCIACVPNTGDNETGGVRVFYLLLSSLMGF